MREMRFAAYVIILKQKELILGLRTRIITIMMTIMMTTMAMSMAMA